MRAERQNLSRSFDQVRFVCELACLRLVDDHQIDLAKCVFQRLAFRGDPQIHRVERHELRPLCLIEHVHLQLGMNIRQEKNIGIFLLLVQTRMEIGEDVQLRVACFRDVEVIAVFATPIKCLRAAHALQAVQIDPSAEEYTHISFSKIITNYRDQIDVGEK